METRVVIITGASAGIGRATADFFDEKGWKVYNLSRRAVEGIDGIVADVTVAEQIEAAIAKIFDTEGRIDAVICNAGMGISGAIEDTDDQSAKRIFDVNFFGVFNTVRAVTPYLREQGFGTIITISSAAAKLSVPFQAFYSASKAAVSSLTEALRLELAPFGIKVTSILPGDVKTDFTAVRKKNAVDNPAYGKRIENSVAKMERDEQNGMPPKVIARLAYKLATSKNPPVYRVGGRVYAVLVWCSKHFPSRLISSAVGKLYG